MANNNKFLSDVSSYLEFYIYEGVKDCKNVRIQPVSVYGPMKVCYSGVMASVDIKIANTCDGGDDKNQLATGRAHPIEHSFLIVLLLAFVSIALA